ncbi:serine/threonine-protein kinase [Fodinicola acaciae]|uniref:serine/threonine-protein kinase n=1 Tax=Fodinicola acaciae TaxID=2681555 RepID=UPI001FEA359C|nr:serine/threonine-protein kinase [Fodinicola acaciae]
MDQAGNGDGGAEGRLVADRYRLRKWIGSGSMGEVWQALDERLNRIVAAKQLLLPVGLSEADAEILRQRSFREGRIAARLHHPNAIAVYDVASDGGRPVLVMEYLPSRSLAEVIDEDGPLPPERVADIGAQAADALAAAHRVGIVHRDVKPANILLGDDGTTKITDFGISRANGDVTVTKTGVLTGTPAYLSPEAARGQPTGPPSDVFALGATLFAGVEGEPPFGRDDNTMALLHLIATGRINQPHKAGRLGPALLRMLSDNPENRPTMAEVAKELAALAKAEPEPTPQPPSLVKKNPPKPALPNIPKFIKSSIPPPRRGEHTRADLPPAHAAASSWSVTNRWLVIIALGAVAVILLSVGAARLLAGPRTVTPPLPTPSPTLSRKPQPSAPAARPSASTIASGLLESVVTRYYGLVPDDLDRAWAMLGPRLQAQGRKAYDNFWQRVNDVRIVTPPRAADSEVTVTIEYNYDGKGAFREQHRLGMITRSGRPLIDSDHVVGSRRTADATPTPSAY